MADDIPRWSDHDQNKNADQFIHFGWRKALQHSNEVVCEMHEDGKQQIPFLLVKDSCGNAHKGGIGSLHDIQVINAEEYR